MLSQLTLRGAIAAVFVALSMGVASAQAPCPADATALADGAKLKCTCEAAASGGVYGSTRYTADSSICQAAKHAGKPAGPVDIVVGGACPSFVGSAANGVTTQSWNSYDKTFSFGDTIATCAVAAAAPAAPAPTATTPTASGGVANCPATMGTKNPGDSLTCVCDAALDLTTGGVYGTDRYSHDSAICSAAKHAGKLAQPGGTVTVYAAAGCGKFDGTARNGITTRNWSSSTPGTIAFVTPPPACAAPAATPPPSTASTTPAGPSPMVAWEARAKTYAAALPAPLAGWTPQPLETRVSNSAVSGREVTAYRIYRIGSHPVGLNSVTVSISNNPDGSARYPIELWNSEAKRTETGATMLKINGRDAMETKSAGGTASETIRSLYFLTKNNLFVSVTWQEPHMTRDKALEYVKALDFAKIEALASK